MEYDIKYDNLHSLATLVEGWVTWLRNVHDCPQMMGIIWGHNKGLQFNPSMHAPMMPCRKAKQNLPSDQQQLSNKGTGGHQEATPARP